MKDESKTKLSEILDAFDAQREAGQAAKQRRQSEREQFLDQFSERVKAVVRPVMEEVREVLKSRGHDADVVENRESAASSSTRIASSVTLTIYPLGDRSRSTAAHNYPHVAVIAKPETKNVYVHESTMMPGRGGHAGSAGEYQLDELTAGLVSQHVLRVLAESMGGP